MTVRIDQHIPSRLALPATLLFAACFALSACQPDSTPAGIAPETTPDTIPAAESEEASTCRMMANSMMAVAEQAVNSPSSRPERRAARRALYEDWQARLAAGEDPCSIYESIAESVNTF